MATAFNIPTEIEMKSYLMMLFDGAGVGPGKVVDGKTSPVFSSVNPSKKKEVAIGTFATN